MAAVINPHLKQIEVPSALRQLPGWIVWRYEHHPGEAKPRKVPYYVDGGRRHGVQGRPEDRRRLTTFEAARAAAARRGFDGVGFCPMAEWGLALLDFDRCVVDGSLVPEVERVCVGTYAEFSPSGNGVRAVVRAEGLGNRKDQRAGTFGFEVFSSKGFVTFTGNVLPICSLLECEDTISDLTPGLQRLCAERFTKEREPREPVESADPPIGLTIEQMREALDVLDPSMPREPWRNVGMALHHETGGSPDAFALWDSWSAGGGDKYPGSDALQAQWDSFGRGYQGPPVTARTLVRMAREEGAHIELSPVDPGEFQAIGGPAPAPLPDRRIRYDLSQVPYDEFVVDGFLSTGTTTIAGGHGAGKSSNLVPLAAAVAHLIASPLRPFLRRRIVWITEYPRQVWKTLYGLLKAAPGAASAEEFAEWFHVIPAERSGAAKLGKFIKQVVDENIVEGPNGYQVYPLVVLDTSNANIEIEHESDNSGIGKAIAAIRKAIGYDRGACWIVTHTPGGQRAAGVDALTARGGTAWEADVDAVAYLAVEGDGRRFMKLGKRRFEAAFDTIEFDSETGVELVTTPWGQTQEVVYRYGSAAPSSMDVVQEARQAKKGAETDAARIVREVIDEMSGDGDPVLNWVSVVEQGKKRLPLPEKGGDKRKQTLDRGRARLVAAGLLWWDGDVAVKRILQKSTEAPLTTHTHSRSQPTHM
jgi:hypothetical protein